jgi:hypothetical protein
MMVSCAPPIVTSPPILMLDWETLARLASRRTKPSDFDTCLTSSCLYRLYGVTDKSKSAWFWGSNQEIIVVILRLKSPNQSYQFWDSNRKPEPPILRPNREKPSQWFWWQPVDHGFNAQPRNLYLSSPCAWCRLHTASPDLPIVRPSSIWPVQPSPILYTRSPTPTTILVATHHTAPITCTLWDKQMWFSTRTKG